MALRAGARPQARGATQRRTLQGLGTAGGDGALRRKLANADDGNRQMVDILTAARPGGRGGLGPACPEAFAPGVPPADVVLNILARQRDPAPPATICTPAALMLRHAPIADCARYDNLRRTI